jgi:hypothetical protein
MADRWEQVHDDHVHVECFVCGRAHVKGRDCDDACYSKDVV